MAPFVPCRRFFASIWMLMTITTTLTSILLTKSRTVSALVIPRPASPLSSPLSSRRQCSLLTTRLWDASSPLSNQELVERRLEVNRAKRAARDRSIQDRVDRNLRIKRMLHTTTTTTTNDDGKCDNDNGNGTPFSVPPLYAVKIWVDETLREELRLNGREKRGRVFLEAGSDGVMTWKGLQGELFAFFRALRKNTFLLTATLPQLSEDGTTVFAQESLAGSSWTIACDEDVLKTFQMADSFFTDHSSLLKRPSIQINVSKDPNAPPPAPPPAYLQGMPNPISSETITMLSFYAFPPSGIEDPEAFAFDLRKKWQPFAALGRVYVAEEGVNAQMSVPTNVLEHFMECCRSVPELGKYMENDINIDPKPLTQDEYAVAGVPINGEPAPPFRNLHVRVRTQVVADGLDKSLDWQSAGYDCPPLEWHQTLKQAREQRDKGGDDEGSPILLDCRNAYETDIGIFDGAEPLNTDSFRDSWDVLKERLVDTPKDAPIMTYCTGGIRCVKVGAYLTQEMGFTNVSRLAGGIIAYDRTLNEKTEGEESMFKGTNFVFDGRLGRQITEDALGACLTCGSDTSLVSNCRNENCHKRMVQCETCRTSFHGSCSDACKNRIINGAMMPRRLETAAGSSSASEESHHYSSLDDYSMGHSSPVPSAYHEMELNTQAYLPSGSHMVSGAAQGRMLTQLASMTREGRILELGTFTGYATVCFLEGARNVGQVTGERNGNMERGPFVLSMERDGRALNLAAGHIQAVVEHGLGESGAESVCALRSSVPDVTDDLISFSMEKVAGCDLLRVTDALATVEAIASGTWDLQPAPFDLVFVDADKTRLLEYVEACLSSDRLLKRGGLIVVDNVLWKGLVVEASSGKFSSVADKEGDGKDDLRKNRRARKLANVMHQFNSAIVMDERVEVMMLPMRDGLSIVRKI